MLMSSFFISPQTSEIILKAFTMSFTSHIYIYRVYIMRIMSQTFVKVDKLEH